MQITVFGASGKVGQQVVNMALAEGHSVHAFIHSTNPFANQPGVTTFKGDVADASSVARALQDSEAVISTLGSWHTKTKDIVATGMAAVIPAMERAGIARIITVTGAGAFWRGDTLRPMDKLQHRLLGLLAPKILYDGEEHLRLLTASQLAWTAVRAPVMLRQTGENYHLSLRPAALYATIPRAAVARCLVDQLKRKDYLSQAPVISRR